MQLVRTSRDTLLRPLMIVSGIAERRNIRSMPEVFGVMRKHAEELLDIRAYLNGFIADGDLWIAGRSRKVSARRNAGLEAQDEPPQQQNYDLCPNCCLRTMLGPIARAPPSDKAEESNSTNKKSVLPTPNNYSKWQQG